MTPRLSSLFLVSLASATIVAAQTPAATPAPSSRAAATPRPSLVPPPSGLLLPPSTPAVSSLLKPTPAPPPREVPLVEKKLEQLSNQEFSEDGRKALSINPTKWRHAETDNFIVHFRRVTEAQKVVREVEFDLRYVATILGAGPERYRRKSHVYVFEDEEEWQQFLSFSNSVARWAASYAMGDELFLNVRGAGNSRGSTNFDSHTLAHETTHAVVARIFPNKRWPLWLNEGFAEYMGGASVAARKGQSGRRYERTLSLSPMPLTTLAELREYPSSEVAIGQLYQTSEKLVRFLMDELPKERIVSFIDAVLAGKNMQTAVVEVYGDKVKDWDTFLKRYERFSK